jgi:hypothetical protein
MAVPSYLNTGFRYFERVGVSDVQQIIDDVAAEVLASSGLGDVAWSPWTNPGAGLYKSPVDAWSRFMDVLFTRVTQQKLEMRLRNQGAETIMTRRIILSSSYTWTVRIYSGPYHLLIDVYMGGAPSQGFSAGILDLSPDPQDCHSLYVYGTGPYDTADFNDNTDNADSAFIKAGTSAAGHTNCVALYGVVGNGGGFGYRTLSGARVYRTREFWTQQIGATGMYGYYHYAGMAYQQLFCPTALCKEGSKQYVPIDTGKLGVFRVIGAAPRPESNWAVCARMA